MNLEPPDVLIIGGGVAGLRAGIAAAEAGASTVVIAVGGGATLLSTADFTACGDHLASRGFAGGNDPPAKLAEDMISAGFGLADSARASRYAAEARDRLDDLLSWGAQPVIQVDRRSLLIPGKQIHCALSSRVTKLQVPVLRRRALGLIRHSGRIAGAILTDGNGNVECVGAGAVILASGGCHHIHSFTTGGDDGAALAQAWALRLGARLIDMEAINFCPHVMLEGEMRGSILPYLVSHIVPFRLLDAEGVDLMDELRAKLANVGERDKLVFSLELARSIVDGRAFPDGSFSFQALVERSAKPAWLHPLLQEQLSESAPQREVLARLMNGERFKVGIAAHYSCGGILADVDGRTDVPGLLVCGEAAGGTFGACRVASSITDGLVFGRAAGLAAARASVKPSSLIELPPNQRADWNPDEAINRIRNIVSYALGPIRRSATLNDAAAGLELLHGQCIGGEATLSHARAADLLLIARATVAAALVRTDSRGFHVRSDRPFADARLSASTQVLLNGQKVCAIVGEICSSGQDSQK